MRRAAAAVVFVGILGTAAATFADPVQVTAGFYTDTWGRGSRWQLSADAFNGAGSGGRFKSFLLQCFSCATGTTVDLDMVLAENFGPGRAEIDGSRYDQVWWTGRLEFDSGTLPAAPGTFHLPFTMTGTLSGFATAATTGPPLFSVALTGTGTVEAFFLGLAEAGEVEFDRVTYTFADPVPEPATMMLLGSGLVAVFGVRRRRAVAAAKRP